MEQVLSETATIQVNGQNEALGVGTLSALLEERGIEAGGRGLAIALNGSVVPRAAWPQVTLQPGDAVEIVQAKQGG